MSTTRKAAGAALAVLLVAGASACADPASRTAVKQNVNQMEHRGHLPGAAADAGDNLNRNEHAAHRDSPAINPREHFAHGGR